MSGCICNTGPGTEGPMADCPIHGRRPRRLHGRWVVQEVHGCTCGTPGPEYGHEPGCGLVPLFQLDNDPTFVVVTARIVGSPAAWEMVYGSDLIQHPTTDEAIAHGWNAHDDWLLAVLDGETVAAVARQHDLRDDAEELAAVATALNLPVRAEQG